MSQRDTPAGDRPVLLEVVKPYDEPKILAGAPPEELRSLGLSRQKALYTHEIALKVSEGILTSIC
jgi:3-methyladenine DNA glycosylase/8-oxoguanine DNA glycosylase